MAQKDENVVSMEKELWHVTKRGGGQVSRGDHQDQPAETEQTLEVSITIHDEAVSTREERHKIFREVAAAEAAAAAAANSTTQAQNDKPKIQRAPFMLRDNQILSKYYEPRVVALGPFHHGKEKYEQAEKIKLQLAVNFLTDSEQNDAALLNKVDENIKKLRECYDEEATKDYDDESLAWMLFVDGCSTLEFIYKYDKLECFKIKRDQVAFAEQDMFLLENQLPYQLLELLMSSTNIHKDLKDSIERFVQMHGVGQDEEQKQQPTLKPEHPAPTHLLELLLTKMLGHPPKNTSGTCADVRPQSFRNVQELQAAGIHFRPGKKGNSLGDIYFKSFLCCGFLYLPKIKVDDSMRPKFMNLIAYEMCPDFQNNFGVTSYIGFLDSLIDHADDVKHLRKKHILQNFLGSDEEVAQLFNEIGTDLVPNYAIYCNVKTKIEKHYKTNWKKWMAQFYEDHFRSPWTFLAFIGVLLGLWMTAVQTWYTVNSGTPPCEALLEYLKARGY